MSKGNSPMYAQGVDDALRDNELVRAGNDPIGPQPPFPAYRVMYDQGYEDAYDPNPPDEKNGTSS